MPSSLPHSREAPKIWTFSIPCRLTCRDGPGTCSRCCPVTTDKALDAEVQQRLEQNFLLAEQKTFVNRTLAFLEKHRIEVVRLHRQGDFYLAAYARKWLRIMRGARDVRFCFRTQSWRRPAIAYVLEQIARLGNVRAGYCCDRQTGVPRVVPPGIELIWRMTSERDFPPRNGLRFRIRRPD